MNGSNFMISKYMILPVYDSVLLPFAETQTISHYHISANEKNRINIDNNTIVLLPVKENLNRKDIISRSFQEYGVIAKILDTKETDMGTVLSIRTFHKVKTIHVSYINDIFEGSFIEHEENYDITQAGEQELLDYLKRTALEVSSKIQGGNMAANYIKACNTINRFGLAFCQFFGMTNDEKYSLLRTDSIKERGLMIKEALIKFKNTVDLREDINRKYNESEGNAYKIAAIQKQISLLQQELKDLSTDNDIDENDYSHKISALGIDGEAKVEVERVLKKYKSAQPNDPEKSSLENYLDFVTSLKWKVESEDTVDLKNARKILDRDHYGLEKVKDRIIQQIAVMSLRKKQTGSILLFIGAPGTGKTSLGKSIAEALGRKYARISLGGIKDEAEIRGHRRTYVGAMPGRIMDGIKRSGSMNPVVVLDEIDKLSQGFNGDPASALLEVLDPEQNNSFTDHYMNIPYDLSNVFFICTANSYESIPQPLLDRMEIIQLSGYTPIEKLQIAKKHLLPKALYDTGLTDIKVSVTDAALKKIVEEYTMEAGVRGLKKQLDKLCRKIAAESIENDFSKITIGVNSIPQYLGKKSIIHDKVLKEGIPGVVTGLAWTQAGGEILFIETKSMHGNGKLSITGQLGDVMKESASIAISLVKSMFVKDNLDFSTTDIHIHVPSGAVPKDGPSAGIALFTAITSLVTGIAPDPKIAMTGEVSLRGNVLPIGGLPEKLMAAQRSGVKKVLIPKDNTVDLDDVPEEVKKSLDIIPVETVDDVLKYSLGIKLNRSDTNLFSVSFEKTVA